MFDQFMNYFQVEDKVIDTGDAYNDFIRQLGGRAFGKGVFNSFSDKNIGQWTEIIGEAFPDFKGKFKVFGYDWLGRCFGIDLRDKSYGNVLLFEIGTNDILEIPCPFEGFLNGEIPLHSDACLAEPFFNEWMEYSKAELQYGRCIGYKIPLFLGGADTVENLEDSDMEVYWSVITQIKNQL